MKSDHETQDPIERALLVGQLIMMDVKLAAGAHGSSRALPLCPPASPSVYPIFVQHELLSTQRAISELPSRSPVMSSFPGECTAWSPVMSSFPEECTAWSPVMSSFPGECTAWSLPLAVRLERPSPGFIYKIIHFSTGNQDSWWRKSGFLNRKSGFFHWNRTCSTALGLSPVIL